MDDFDLVDAASVEQDVWPENWPAVMLFNQMSTQWRYGLNGVFGLDYNAIFSWMDIEGWGVEVKRDVFSGLQVIEKRVLEKINEVS